MSVSTISPKELAARRERGEACDLIDVRTPVEFRQLHVTFARNEPLDRLDPQALINARNGASEEPLYFICQLGKRGSQACEKFITAGFKNVVNIEGGMHAWEQAGLPVARGQAVMLLERQVRIAAGLLVLIGSVLGYFVSPYWIGLSAFVGAGLAYAGITDTCGMAMLLARMPWNQVESKSSDQPTTSGPACSRPSCCG